MYLFIKGFEELYGFCVLALPVKKMEKGMKKKNRFQKRKLKLLLALSGLEYIQGGCFPD